MTDLVADVYEIHAIPRPVVATCLVDLTPELALQYLEHNTHNRPLRWRKVEEYAAEMTAGRWQLNGDAIRFDWNGVMLDGQTRCHAVIASGVTVRLIVIRGLDPASQITMDVGKRRAPHEQLAVADIAADVLIAAAIRVLININENRLWENQDVSTGEIVAWAQANRERVERMQELYSWSLRRIRVRPALSTAMAVRLSEIDADAAEEFFGSLASGVNLDDISPIYALRERFARLREAGMRLHDREYIGLYTLAWNAWRAGRSLTKVQRPKGGWTPENFPEPT